MTIREAAEATGLTQKAIKRRVERGSLRSVLRDGRRLIPASEIERAGLAGDVVHAPQGPGSNGATPPGLAELVAIIERQATELAEAKLLTRQAESLSVVAEQERQRANELEAQLHELRAKLAQAEAQRPWWRRRTVAA